MEEAAPDEPTSETRGLLGRVVRGVVALVALVGVAVVAGGIALLYPYLRDDIALDRIVRAVALDWRDFGEERAQERLRYELDHEAVSAAVGDDACSLEREGETKRVSCEWAVQIALPIAGNVPLSFSSVAVVDAAGELK